ncbi:MAG: carbohydrate porin, partial [Planctomycetes bacterium]|nr:carbohydrate porin [Planctomycetota bacterium]
GGWRHTGTFDKFDGGRRTGSNGGYVVAEQTILPESSEGEGLVAFLLAGLGDEEVNAIERHAGIGVVYRGALPGRNDDVIGLGCTRVEFSDRTGAGFTENSEVLWELFYQAQVTPWLVVQPDLQWIRDPGGDATIGDAWVGSLRVEITL